MAHQNPRQAIIEYFVRPPGVLIWQSSSSPDRWRSSLTEPGGQDANPHTVQFVRERASPQRQLHFVRFNTRAGNRRLFVVELVRQPDG